MNYIKPFTDIFGIKPGEEFGILFPAERLNGNGWEELDKSQRNANRKDPHWRC